MNSDFALALHCILLLAHYSGKMITSVQLSKIVSVHPVRVRKVLSLLKKAGYITSKEGSKGGFLLSCDTDIVKLDDIYQLTQRDVLNPKCHVCPDYCKIGANIENVLVDIFTEADNKLQDFLMTYSLQDILDKLQK